MSIPRQNRLFTLAICLAFLLIGTHSVQNLRNQQIRFLNEEILLKKESELAESSNDNEGEPTQELIISRKGTEVSQELVKQMSLETSAVGANYQMKPAVRFTISSGSVTTKEIPTGLVESQNFVEFSDGFSDETKAARTEEESTGSQEESNESEEESNESEEESRETEEESSGTEEENNETEEESSGTEDESSGTEDESSETEEESNETEDESSGTEDESSGTEEENNETEEESSGTEDESNETEDESTSSSSTSEDFSDETVDISDLELVQSFFYIRHGAATDQHWLYESEWQPYKMKISLDTIHEQLTPLGEAQCWSIGRHLAEEYPELMEEIIENEDYVFNLIQLRKQKRCSNFIWYGINNYIPFIGLFSDNGIAEQTIEEKGRCYHCDSDSHFPYDLSQELSEGTSNNSEKPRKVKMHPEKFLDLDDSCKTRFKFLCLEVDPLPLSDVALFKKATTYFRIENWDAYYAVQMLFKHLNHNLPLEHGLEKVSETFLNRARRMKDGNTECFTESILNVVDYNWVLPALFSRTLIKDLITNLESQDAKANFYVSHNNNVLSLLVYFLGAKEGLSVYTVYYASRLVLEVYEHPTTGKKYVQLKWNDTTMDIRDCEGLCEFDQFKSLLHTYTKLGGDLKEWCGTEKGPSLYSASTSSSTPVFSDEYFSDGMPSSSDA